MRIRHRKRHFWLLIFSFLIFCALVYLVLNFDPTDQFTIHLPSMLRKTLQLDNLPLSIPTIFFLLLFLLSFSLTSYLLNNLRRGIFVGFFTTSYFLLRFFHLTHISLLILLIALFVTLELFFSRRR